MTTPSAPLPGASAPVAPASAAPLPATSPAVPAGLAAGTDEMSADQVHDEGPATDPEPPIETPTPTQAEIDDIKRGIRQPDPPIVPAKMGRTVKPTRGGGYTTRDLTGGT